MWKRKARREDILLKNTSSNIREATTTRNMCADSYHILVDEPRNSSQRFTVVYVMQKRSFLSNPKILEAQEARYLLFSS